jgi:hypothetical protein
MAPTKRTIKETAPAPASQAKKAKNGTPEQKLLKEITGAFQLAAISDDVRQMLTDILPCSLGECSDQRSKFQEQVVESVACILTEVEASLNKSIDDARSQRDTAASEKPLRDKEAQDATVKLETAKDDTKRFKVALADKALAFRAATASLAEAQEAKKMDAQRSQEAAKQKGHFEVALEDLTVLKSISPEEPEAGTKQDELVACLKKYKFEESILIALPAALAKAPDARGQFDLMAISQLEGEISKRIAEQESIVLAAKPGQDACEATVLQAQEHLNGARAEQRAAAKSFDSASKEEAACEEASIAALKVVREMASSSKRFEKVVFDAEVELELFQQGPIEAFTRLRQRVTPPPAPVAEEETATPTPMVEEATTEPVAMEQQPVEEQASEVPVVAAC